MKKKGPNHRRRWNRAGLFGTAALPALLTALIGAGCFFSPRDADDPNVEGPGISEPAKSAEEVTTMLQGAYDSFDQAQYEILLTEDLVFRPDPLDSTDLADAGIFPFAETWGFTAEEDAFNRIVSCFNDGATRFGSISLAYTGEPVLNDSSVTGFSRYETDYAIGIFYFNLQTSLGDSLKFDGSMRLFIRDEGDGTYRIYRWEDLRKGELTTWGFYKGQVASSQSYCPE